MRSPFLVNVSVIFRSGASRRVQVAAPIDDLFVTGSEVPEGSDVEVDLELVPLGHTIEASGFVRATWEGDCRRCLKRAVGVVEGEVHELFEPDPVEGESYGLRHDEVDLEPLARETVVLELPQAPLCREDCLGLCPDCGVDRNEGTCSCEPALDPRWSVLDELRTTERRSEES